MRNKGDVYYYIIDNNNGRDFATLAEAVAEFQLPNTTPEKIIVEARVLRKKVIVQTETEVT